MKNKIIVVALLTFCFLLSLAETVQAQSTQSTSNTNKRIKLKAAPELKAKLPIKRRDLERAGFLVTGSGGFEPSFEVEHNDINFTVTALKDKRISYISTSDVHFKSDEGIAINDSLQKVLEISEGKLIRERGWAFFVELKSGWNAGFLQGSSGAEGDLPPEAKVAFLFKR